MTLAPIGILAQSALSVASPSGTGLCLPERSCEVRTVQPPGASSEWAVMLFDARAALGRFRAIALVEETHSEPDTGAKRADRAKREAGGASHLSSGWISGSPKSSFGEPVVHLLMMRASEVMYIPSPR